LGLKGGILSTAPNTLSNPPKLGGLRASYWQRARNSA
jgi:hypothetical protein